MDTVLGLILVLLQIPDVITTNLVLREGGRELNPLMRLCMRLGSLWWVPKLVIAAVCVAVILAESGGEGDAAALVALGLLDLAYLAVVGSNLWQLRKLRMRRGSARIPAG